MAEKSLNELPRELRGLFTKGSDALQRDNFDYAIDLFSQILAKEPTQYEVRKALRTAQIKKAGSGGGFFKKMMSSASSSPLVAKAHMALGKNPAEALQTAEQILNSDPHSSAAHKIVVEAATALELPRTAVMSLEILARNSPKDVHWAIPGSRAAPRSFCPTSTGPFRPTTIWRKHSRTFPPAPHWMRADTRHWPTAAAPIETS